MLIEAEQEGRDPVAAVEACGGAGPGDLAQMCPGRGEGGRGHGVARRQRLGSPCGTALRRTSAIQTLVVQIVAEDGTTGFGEAPQVWQVTGDPVAGARACVEGPMTARILGRDVDDTVRLLRDMRDAVAGNTGARAAVDIAVHDLLARLHGMPLVRWPAVRMPEDAQADIELVEQPIAAHNIDGPGIATKEQK